MSDKTPSGAMTWAALHTKILNDARFMRCSDQARLLFLLALPLTAAQGLEGLIPADPCDMQFVVRLKGGDKASEEAVDELLRCGLLLRTDDEGHLLIAGWEKNQRDRSGSATRPASSSRGQLIRYHNAGKHEGQPKDGCELCASSTPAPVQLPTVTGTQVAAPVSDELTARNVKQKVWERCDQLLELADQDGATALEAYEAAYEAAEKAAAKYAHVKGIGPATLLNTVVSHAAGTFLARDGSAIADGTLRFLHGLRKDHGPDLLVKMADPLVTQSTNPVAYLRGIYRQAVAA